MVKAADACSYSNLAHPSGTRNFLMTLPTSPFDAQSAAQKAETAARILRMPRAVFEDLRAHGEETWPRECCGALLGKPEGAGWRIELLVRATNARSDFAHYEIAAAELVKIAQDARIHGFEIAGFYHSHPDHPAEWSPTDLAEAHWLGASYVITEIAKGKAADTRAWLLAGTCEEDKRFEAQEIRVE